MLVPFPHCKSFLGYLECFNHVASLQRIAPHGRTTITEQQAAMQGRTV